jgi:superfamily II DNA or RNA helicase
VLKLLQTGQARLLIADEVGLGKTIEAGLIWTELEARHDADRVLIVCPSMLVEKWRDEMQERFGFDLTQLDRNELNRLLEQHREGRVPKRKAYVVSLESLRAWDGLKELQDKPPEFDLVIVDEAHSMRNSDTKSYQLGTQLSEWTIGSNMVFLTATPINLRETDLLHLLGLLEPADFDTLEDLEARLAPNAVLNEAGKMLTQGDATAERFTEILSELKGMVFEKAITLRPEFRDLQEILTRAPLSPKDVAAARGMISKLNALSTTVTRTRRTEVDEKKALRDAEPGIEIKWSPVESAFYEEFLKWCSHRAKLANTAMYFSMQMPIRLASTSVHIAARSVLRDDPEIWSGDAAQDRGKNWVEPHHELIAAAQQVLEAPDTKLSRLGEVLAELHQLGRQALLFTWSKANLRYLQDAYKDKYRIAVLNGDVRREQRRTIMKDFRAGRYDFLFANRVASEGLDFEFCSAVINYDLPWNPMEVEQRIGRIDRIGQQSEKILIRNFYNDEAIDSRIMFRVLQRIQIFERSIGELEPIISQHMDELRAAMDFTLTPEQQEQKAQQFLTAIEAQRDGVREVADSAAGLIIANDVEIAGFEEELVSSGRYLGQVELAHLLDDWAYADGGDKITWLEDGKLIEFRGSTAMAARLIELTQSGRRTRAETSALVVSLQNNDPIYLSLDQELARTSEVDLLSATHPLVMAATEVPGHRQARFASVRIAPNENIAPGKYVIVLAHAENASRGGDEIWGAAVDEAGENCGEAPADALLAALARGSLAEGEDLEVSPLPRLAGRARRELEKRHRLVQDERDVEENALIEARRAILADQHERRLRGIQRRMQTMLDRERGHQVLRMVEGQRSRQQDRYQQLIAELDAKKPPAVSLSYLATCVLDVSS